ncbi:MAG: hypothetical protein LQ342_002452 [Letrouitia transgressa]|nr:MAG: hypothetical protein LQ342_002452 [Letrouitia transgressa]
MGRATAIFNGTVIAQADSYQFVEGNVYFPPSSITSAVKLTPTFINTTCPWKGMANYYDISVGGQESKDAAWYYPEPKTDRAKPLKDHIAFCEFLFKSGFEWLRKR